MIKIFSLLALALVVSAIDNALSAPVSRESTKETPSDPVASTPSNSKSIRGAEEDDVPDIHDSKERLFSVNIADDAAGLLKPLRSAKPINLPTGTTSEQLVAKTKRLYYSTIGGNTPRYRKANKMIAKGASYDDMYEASVHPAAYARALSHRFSSRDGAANAEASKMVLAYTSFYIGRLNKDFAALSEGIEALKFST